MGESPGTKHCDRLLASQARRITSRRDLCSEVRRDDTPIRQSYVCEFEG
jgi:hypothetical protein